MTLAEWISVITQVNAMGFIKLNFTGGEPLLRSDVLDIIKYASSISRAELHLNTNGILLTPLRAKALIDAGVYSYNISIDGSSPESHDVIRGQRGAFKNTIENMDALLELRDHHQLKVRMCCTVMNKNLNQLIEVARFAQRRNVQLFFNVVTDKTFLFRNKGIRKLGEVEMNVLEDVCGRLLELIRQNPRFLPAHSDISYLMDHFHDEVQRSLPCAESQLKLMIHSRGQVGGCWAEDPVFSLRQESLANILQSDEFRKRQSSLYWKQCCGCGSNYALNMRLSPQYVLYDFIRKMGLYQHKRR
jgi:MoaA/NifB/PqqE/SkfB family radical SAM enzyme